MAVLWYSGIKVLRYCGVAVLRCDIRYIILMVEKMYYLKLIALAVFSVKASVPSV